MNFIEEYKKAYKIRRIEEYFLEMFRSSELTFLFKLFVIN
jgi:hypothetical protein